MSMSFRNCIIAALTTPLASLSIAADHGYRFWPATGQVWHRGTNLCQLRTLERPDADLSRFQGRATYNFERHYRECVRTSGTCLRNADHTQWGYNSQHLGECGDVSAMDLTTANLAPQSNGGQRQALHGLFAKETNFSGANLREIGIYGGMFIKTNFSNADMHAAWLWNGLFHESKFDGANMPYSALMGRTSSYTYVVFQGGGLWPNCRDGMSARGANLSRSFIHLSGACSDFRSANFSNTLARFGVLDSLPDRIVPFALPMGSENAHWSRFNFARTNLESANFSGSRINDFQCVGCKLKNVNFSDAKIGHLQIYLMMTDLDGANFSNADIRGAIFRAEASYKIDFERVNFANAKLQGAYFDQVAFRSGTSLRGADLRCARLVRSELNLNDFDIAGANMQCTTFQDVRARTASLDTVEEQRARGIISQSDWDQNTPRGVECRQLCGGARHLLTGGILP
jgi:uncharacterized protein YjbI with pentapeptide repeats